MANDRDAVALGQIRRLFGGGVTGDLTDGELLRRFLGRDGQSAEFAFAALVERHGPMVLRVARSILRESHDAEDAFQATFLVLARKAGSLRVVDSVAPWLHGVTYRVAACIRSAEVRRRIKERRASEGAPTLIIDRDGDDLGSVLNEEIERLPDRYRTAVVLCLLQGLTQEQAGHSLGWPSGTVRSRLARGRRLLQDRLARRGLTPSAVLSGVRISSASVTLPLIESTTRAALDSLSGSLSAGAISPSVIKLTSNVSSSLTMSQYKLTAILWLTICAGAAGFQAFARQKPEDPSAAAKAEPAKAQSPRGKAGPAGDRPAGAEPSSTGTFRFHGGFHDGSLRSEVPLPVYDPDPGHLWNRLFTALWVRPLRPGGRDSSWPVEPPTLGVDDRVPPGLSPALRELWRSTYNRDPNRRIEGGDVLEPPLFPHPYSLLGGRSFEAVNAVLDEFLRDQGERLARDPLKRALLQRDLWPVFDLLQREYFWDKGTPVEGHEGQNPNKRYDPIETERRVLLARKVAAVMGALALTKEEVASLPDTYGQAVRSGRFAADHGFEPARAYLPPHLMDGAGDWVEVNTYLAGANFGGLPMHAGSQGFEGRSWFRVFYRFPASAGGRRALEAFLADPRTYDRDEHNLATGPDVPPGTEFALARILLTIDRDGDIQPTKIVEDLQVRVLRHIDGREHPDTDSGFGQNLYQYELRRANLFEGSSGLVRISDDAPRYSFGVFPFATFATSYQGTPEAAGGLEPLRKTCVSCHKHANQPSRLRDGSLRGFPEGYPYGKGSLRSLDRARIPFPAGGATDLARRAIDWKTSQPSFQRFAAETAKAN
jgi:RNA polymerase sigma factor (sigma-70 family)